MADSDAGKQGHSNARRHVGVTIGYASVTGKTAAVGIAGIGWWTGTDRNVRAGRDIGAGEDARTRTARRFFNSGSPTPLPLLGREAPHQRQTTLPARSVGHGGEGESVGHGEGERGTVAGENLPTPDTTAAPPNVHLSSESNETSVDADVSVGSDTSSSDGSRPVPAMVRPAERALT